MNRALLSLAAAAAITAAVSLVPSRANALGVGTAAAIDNAINDTAGLQDVRWVCRWRYGYRRCFWVPGVRYYRPYRYRRWRYY